MTAVTARVPAKVNLQLSVGPPGADGYHDLVTVFHALALFDEVTVTSAVELSAAQRTHYAEALAKRLGREVRLNCQTDPELLGGAVVRADDLVIAISSSGRSANILNAVKAARAAKCAVVTFSGFTADNPLRGLGDLNFYVASDRYGFVEIGHLTICHAILDFICGLRVPEGMMPAGATAA